MERDSKMVSRMSYGLVGPAFRVFNRLIAGPRSAGRLLAAAREINYAANWQDGTHSALKQVVDRTYCKHGILTTPLWQGEGIKPSMTEEGEVSVEVVSLSEEVRLALGPRAGEKQLSDVFAKAGFGSLRRAASTLFNLVLEARR